jgi:hypothetical protein
MARLRPVGMPRLGGGRRLELVRLSGDDGWHTAVFLRAQGDWAASPPGGRVVLGGAVGCERASGEPGGGVSGVVGELCGGAASRERGGVMALSIGSLSPNYARHGTGFGDWPRHWPVDGVCAGVRGAQFHFISEAQTRAAAAHAEVTREAATAVFAKSWRGENGIVAVCAERRA